MPFLAVVVPQVPEEHKDQFLAAFPKIAAEIKALPMVLGVWAGPIVAEDGAAASGFKFIQTIGKIFLFHFTYSYYLHDLD
jgi:hypothetical protein